MLLTEYDERKHMRDTYREGYEDGEQAGYSKGEQAMLETLIQRKLRQGKVAEVIAQELELEIVKVREVIHKLQP